MQVDIGNNQICHNFRGIVSSAEIRDLNERVQQEHPQQQGGGSAALTAPPRRVDPNAGVPPAGAEPAARTTRHGSLNLSRSSAGSRHSHHTSHQQQRRHSYAHPQVRQSSTPRSRSAASRTPDDAILPPPQQSQQQSSSSAQLAPAQHVSTSMAAIASSSHRQGGNWSDAPRNGTAGSGHAAGAAGNGENGAANANRGAVNNNNNHHSTNANNNNNRGHNDDGGDAAGSQNDNNNNNGSGNPDKPAAPAGPKLAQTKIQLGMRLRRWVVINRIGAGSFGETFTAMEVDGPIAEEDTLVVTPENLALLDHLPPLEERHEVCIKVEQENKNVLRLEALALKKVQPCPQVVRYLGSGCTSGMNYLVMEKLGPNLAELRRRSQHGTFNIYTTLKAGISCLTAIRGVHDLGLVHRDIKPSNFVTGLPNTPAHTTCYLIDFGLARRFRRSNGEIRPPRDNAGFRGTSRYASVASHHHQELGRVDDLWSLLFMLVEFATGTLPWRKYKDKDDIGRCKEESITPHLVRNLPREFQPFLAHLQTLRYEDEPDYDLLVTLMHRALERRGYPPNKPVEWELDPSMIDSGMDAEGHDAGRNEAENAPGPSAAVTSPAQPSSSFQVHQQQQQSATNIGPVPEVAGHPSADNYGQRVSANTAAGNLSDSAARKGSHHLLQAPLPPGSPYANGGAANAHRSTPVGADPINAHADNNNSNYHTPKHHGSGMLRMSDVDVLGGAGGRGSAAEASIPPAAAGAGPHVGTAEEPGGATVFRPEGSETPAAQASSDEFDPNEFSPREMPSPANADRDDYGRPLRPSSAPVSGSVGVPPPSNSALEPNNSTQGKELAGGERRSSGLAVHPHGESDAFGNADDAMGKVGNASIQRPQTRPAVDLDAPNNDPATAQQPRPDGKGPPKHKKKSNCDCKVM